MTPLSAIFSAIFLAFILLLMAPLTVHLPIPAMGGVILLVAFNLIDFRNIRDIIKTSKDEAAVLLTTFFATLFLDLEFAIYSGVLMSLILYLSRTAHPEIVEVTHNHDALGQSFKIIRIDGSLFFGAVHHIMEFLYNIDKNKTYKYHLLIVAYGVNLIDITGAEMLVNESVRRRGLRGDLYLCGLKKRAREVLERGGYINSIGADHIFSTETEAIAKITERIDHLEF